MPTKKKRIMVALYKNTYQRLCRFLESYRSWKACDGKSRKIPRYQRPTLADAVIELLDRVDKHKERSKRSGRSQAFKGMIEDFTADVVRELTDPIGPLEPVLDLEGSGLDPANLRTLEEACRDPQGFVDGMVETLATHHELPAHLRRS